MQTINSDNLKSSESHYVTQTDIRNMDPCSFPNKRNPLTGASCRETFSTSEVALPNDLLTQVYFAGLAGLGLLIFSRLVNK
jgi:hypothetical protein